MPAIFRPHPLFALLAAPVLFLQPGCTDDGPDSSGTEDAQVTEEQEDVAEVKEELQDAKEELVEAAEEVDETREKLREAVVGKEEAEDAIGDLERQLEKEKADVRAERTDAEPDFESELNVGAEANELEGGAGRPQLDDDGGVDIDVDVDQP